MIILNYHKTSAVIKMPLHSLFYHVILNPIQELHFDLPNKKKIKSSYAENIVSYLLE